MATHAENMARLKVQAWDDGACVVTLDGRPVGQAETRYDAENARQWLATALGDILAPLEAEVATLHKILGDKIQDSDVMQALVRLGMREAERIVRELHGRAESRMVELLPQGRHMPYVDQAAALRRAADAIAEASAGPVADIEERGRRAGLEQAHRFVVGIPHREAWAVAARQIEDAIRDSAKEEAS